MAIQNKHVLTISTPQERASLHTNGHKMNPRAKGVQKSSVLNATPRARMRFSPIAGAPVSKPAYTTPLLTGHSRATGLHRTQFHLPI